MRFRAHLANVATFTKLIDSVNKLAKRAVFTFAPDELSLVSTGDDEDGLRLHGTIQVAELFGSNYHVESNNNNTIPLEFSTQALASAVRQTSSSPTEIVIRLGRIGKTPYLSFAAKTVGRSGAEYQVEQRVAVRILRPDDAKALPKPKSPVPDVILSLPKVNDLCKVADRLKSLSDLITVSASRNGGFRLGISTEHARVETEWRGLTPFHRDSSQATQDAQGTPRPTSAFCEATVKSRALLRFLHAHVGEVSLASICEGYGVILYNYIGDSARLIATDNAEGMTGSLIAFLPAVNEDGDA
ncbi:hypothetical protein MJO28_014969 [Puccinia striiformis f. sp. tritici]|uniref:Checkpoint protein n=3 Tax=Puccinia striiformis TaxID=27350 RepID=A0A0L0UXH8_9BASI|nr:hypothetical protein Pst134EA_027833 [Puccinia striiformis f. sp. tritici]KNE91631.1 hypothetical protein PSTG_14939 [Puccinia striiformis f. sp. tritici PST-78]POW11656.1 hypothetical protein PSTT_05193 [Puccinia striiformis]KAH9442123.1 hypothetical protein Pst134EB_028387 [Puccinia striiformis f. sp. tritici]KAH9448522.1 hypothetical protein Pst134EA_027833 [Puccinia striiformis f. sp. tritici]KAI7937419.1 hypothetical protein MJO29_014734 [Puccinia striiformis f. sp. tritici]